MAILTARHAAAWALCGLLGASATAQLQHTDPALASELWRGDHAVSGRLLVRWRDALEPAQAQRVRDELNLRAGRPLPQGFVLLEDPAQRDLTTLMAAVAERDEVLWAQPDLLLQPTDAPDDPLWPQQWGPLQLALDQAWALTPGAPGTVLAVLDSGADLDHADLGGQIAWGLDTFAGDELAEDIFGHGTHCAGIAAAAGDDGVGVAGAAGRCRLAIYRCGNGSFPTSALLLALDDAVVRGARVLSLSWGSYASNPALRVGVLEATDAGCVVLASAGNDNSTTPFYPAAWPEVVGVASSDPFDARSAFSNHGPWVDLAAPGQSILSCGLNNNWVQKSGTSMACPLAAGTAALLYARLGGARSAQRAEWVRAALLDSSLPVGAWVAAGRLDPPAAVARLDQLSPPPLAGLAAPALVAEGHELVLDLHGPPGATAALLLSPSSATLSISGQALLADAQPLLLGDLPADGWLSLSALVPPGTAGAELWWQLVLRPAPGELAASATLSTHFSP